MACWKQDQPGDADCPCDGGCGSITVTVRGCGAVLPGVTVTVKLSGVTVASGTTDGSGVYVATGLAAGSYSVSSTASLYNTATATVTVDCATSPNPSVTLSPAAATGHFCCGCATPLAAGSTRTLTTNQGTVTVTWTGAQYEGSITVSMTAATVDLLTCAVSSGTHDVTFHYAVGCAGFPGGLWTVHSTCNGLTWTNDGGFTFSNAVLADGEGPSFGSCAGRSLFLLKARATITNTCSFPVSGTATTRDSIDNACPTCFPSPDAGTMALDV